MLRGFFDDVKEMANPVTMALREKHSALEYSTSSFEDLLDARSSIRCVVVPGPPLSPPQGSSLRLSSPPMSALPLHQVTRPMLSIEGFQVLPLGSRVRIWVYLQS